MTYEETLAHIYGLRRFGLKPGLERVLSLLNALSNPQDGLQVVHVAGTNGKGSTAAFLASIMSSGGYRVGLFTSPHLISFTERFRINGIEIPENKICSLAEQAIAAAPPATTFFELVTAMALLYFANEKVDLVILEAGMGGGLDATNAVPGILSVITPIALDHCDYLGNTVSAIASEKSGIINRGRPVVVSAQPAEAREVLEERCQAIGSPLRLWGRDYLSVWDNNGFACRGMTRSFIGLHPGIPGRYQEVNAAAAIAAGELLSESGFPLADAAFMQGIENARWPGRMETFGQAPRILLDGAHNPAGGEALADALKDIPRRRLILVAGVMEDKNADGILSPLVNLADEAIAVSPAIERALPSCRLARLLQDHGIPCVDGGSVASGIAAALEQAAPEDLVVVCGSLFTVGEARAHLLSRRFEPFRG